MMAIKEVEDSKLTYPALPHQMRQKSTSSASENVTESSSSDIISNALTHHLEEEQAQKEFTEKKAAIISLLDSSKNLLLEISSYCNDHKTAIIKYPFATDETHATNGCRNTFKVLKLELRSPGRKFGQDILHSLNHASIAQLLCSRFTETVKHLDKIKSRVEDTFSKVLITGDLNSGKSTFINSILRRDILPSDQQPCTTMFCEVLSSSANNGEEAVHGVPDPSAYDANHLKSFTKFDMNHIKVALTTEETGPYNLWKVYANENRSAGESLLKNGVVDLVLIDSPGLNRDFTQTMAVFSQHEEIDAVIFVVNSENHFTLSGTEFLSEAQKEKPHMFIVVNRFDLIKEKERCKQNILKQVAELLPKTAEHSDELVHFVSSRDFLRSQIDGTDHTTKGEDDYAFLNLESCLRSFLLEKRTRTKLAPAKIYISNLLQDIKTVSMYNEQLATEQLDSTETDLGLLVPEFARLVALSENYETRLEKTISDTLQLVQLNSQQLIEKFIANIGEYSREVSYPGIFGLWNYADAIVRHANMKLLGNVERHEVDIHMRVTQDVKNLYDFPAENVPEWIDVAGNIDRYLPSPPQVIVDIREQQLVRVDVELGDFMEVPSNLSTIGMTVGAVSIIGGGLVGYRRVASGLFHVGSTMATGDTIGKMVWGGIAVAGIAITAVLLYDAPNTVQRKLIRKIRKNVKKSERIHKRLHRCGYHARKTLEKSTFELKKNVCKIVENKEQECERLESEKVEAFKNKKYFGELKNKASGLLDILDTVQIDDYSKGLIQRK